MAKSAAKKAAATRKRKAAARKAATTRKRRAAGARAATTPKRRTIDKKTGSAVDEPRAEFITEGKFLKLWPEPRFTRTGAVLVVREHLLERNPFEEDFEAWTELRWFVLHNPHAPVQIPQEPWGNCPQLVRDGDNIRWTDGGPVDGSPA